MRILADASYNASYSGPQTLQSMRAATSQLSLHALVRQVHPDARVQNETLGGVACESITTPGADVTHAIIYLHGGAFVRGNLDLGRANASLLAVVTGVRVIAVGYRQAPEHPYPAAPRDVQQVYEALLRSGISHGAIVVLGESSGGCLALGLAATLDGRTEDLPAGIAALSPMVDLELRGASWIYNADKDIANIEVGRKATSLYVTDSQKQEPGASPIRFHYRRCCPIFLAVGSHETMLSDTEHLARKADDAGVDVSFNIYEGMPHGFTRFDTDIAKQSILDAGQWCMRQFH